MFAVPPGFHNCNPLASSLFSLSNNVGFEGRDGWSKFETKFQHKMCLFFKMRVATVGYAANAVFLVGWKILPTRDAGITGHQVRTDLVSPLAYAWLGLNTASSSERMNAGSACVEQHSLVPKETKRRNF